jgi:hypothetical protein
MIDFVNSDITNLVAVVLFLLPGFLAILFFQYLVPSREKSDLQTTVLSVASSVGLSYLSGLFYNLLDLLSKIKINLTPSKFVFSLTSLIIGVLLASLIAKITRSDSFSNIVKRKPFGRPWDHFLDSTANTVVKVFTTDNKAYVGIIKEFSVDPSDDVQEIILWKPVYFDAYTKKLYRVKEVETVLLKGSAITSIEKIVEEEAGKIYPFTKAKKK